MPSPSRITMPLDEWGQLVLRRREGESLAEYRGRVLQAAPQITYRDRWSETWLRAREAELSARVGEPVRLGRLGGVEGAEAGLSSVFDYESVEALPPGRPFHWPLATAGGPSPEFASEVTRESGSAGGLVPRRDGGRVLASGGAFLLNGLLWHWRRRRQALLSLPEGTEETALPPWNVRSGHPHKFVSRGRGLIHMVGTDGHRHELEQRGDRVVQTSGPHVHEIETVRPQETMLIELFRGDAEPGPAVLEPHQGSPDIGRDPRTLRILSSEGETVETQSAPGELAARIEEGWVVASLPEGVRSVALYFPTPGDVDLGGAPQSEEEYVGFGPALPASHLHLEEARAVSGGMRLLVRVEDERTGGIPGWEVEARAGSSLGTGVSGESGAAEILLSSAADGPVQIEASAEGPEGEVLSATWTRQAERGRAPDGYGVDYGTEYGS